LQLCSIQNPKSNTTAVKKSNCDEKFILKVSEEDFLLLKMNESRCGG
jgi:hypothetical protein